MGAATEKVLSLSGIEAATGSLSEVFFVGCKCVCMSFMYDGPLCMMVLRGAGPCKSVSTA